MNEVFDCLSDAPLAASRSHYHYHRYRGEEVCLRAKMEVSRAHWVKRGKDLSDWVYQGERGAYLPRGSSEEEKKRKQHRKKWCSDEFYGKVPSQMFSYLCWPDLSGTDSGAHYNWHIRRGEEPCELSKRNHAKRHRKMRHGNLDGYEYKNRTHILALPHIVYELVCVCGKRYYGITAGPLDFRKQSHRRSTQKVGRHLRSCDMDFTIELLWNANDFYHARALEDMMISGCPEDLLLNSRIPAKV